MSEQCPICRRYFKVGLWGHAQECAQAEAERAPRGYETVRDMIEGRPAPSRPINLHQWEVRAIRDRRLTQLRRPVKPQPVYGYVLHGDVLLPLDGDGCAIADKHRRVKIPYRPGDVLWGRETWGWYGRNRGEGVEGGLQYRADCGRRSLDQLPEPDARWEDFDAAWDRSECNTWRSSTTMPRWASRITLEVTGVRVQRVQEISAADAQAEGMAHIDVAYRVYNERPMTKEQAWVDAFRESWDSTYARTYPWSGNPWVWVYEVRPAK